jgi:integrase
MVDANSIFVVPSIRTMREMSLSAFKRLWELLVGYTYKVRGTGGKLVIKDGEQVMKSVPGLVDFYVAPHLLRHTYITELCLSGMDIKKIQYLAGHETAEITLEIYIEAMGNSPSEIGPLIVNHFSGNRKVDTCVDTCEALAT